MSMARLSHSQGKLQQARELLARFTGGYGGLRHTQSEGGEGVAGGASLKFDLGTADDLPGMREEVVPFYSGATLVWSSVPEFSIWTTVTSTNACAEHLAAASSANTGWAEGFDTRDLKEAKALLEELAA